MDVSIIIVAWNVRELLHNCLKSVFDQTEGISFEVIYVDNASEDGSVRMVAEEFPKVRIIENTENRGFIQANNQAIEVANGRYILLLNSDTIVLDNAIAEMVRFTDAHAEAAVVGCRVLHPDMTLQRTCFMYPSALNMLLSATHLYKIFPKSRFFGRELMSWWDYNDIREVETICGCCALVRKKAVEQVGLMDETYFVYGDDPDWCYRFRKNGWKVLYTPNATIIHYGGQTTKQVASRFMLQLQGSRLIFVRKHGHKLAFPLARFLTAAFFLFRVPYWLVSAICHSDERKNSIQTARTYLIGGFYCLAGWKNLLMNKDEIGNCERE